MIQKPIDVLANYPVRKSKRQKAAFRQDVQTYLQTLGYGSYVEKGSFGSRNFVIGDPENASYLITAHYDTCAHLPFPNLITPCNPFLFLLYQLLIAAAIFLLAVLCGTLLGLLLKDGVYMLLGAYLMLFILLAVMMVGPANRHNANDNTSGVVALLEIARTLPESQRNKVCFVLFDLEEAGLIGSSSFRRKHKRSSQHQLVLNLDCVGDGDEIVLFPTGRLRKNTAMLAKIQTVCGECGKKSLTLRRKGFAVYPSDQANFPFGVGIAALHRSKLAGLYLSRIHTNRDTNLDYTNVNILRACLISLISSDAMK